MRNIWRRTVVVIGILAVLSGCGTRDASSPTDGPLPTVAGIPPLAYLVEQIGGRHVKVEALVRPGQDPHTFEPMPQQVLALGRAAIFFKVDMPFETVLLRKIQEGNRLLKVVDATEGIKRRSMGAPCCSTSADRDHEHPTDEGNADPHLWLSPPLLKIQAQNIAAALCRADPAHERDYQKNLATLLDRLDTLHERVKQMLAPYRGRAFYVFHPAFGYFADAYELKEEAIEAGGRSPTPKQLRALIEEAQVDGIRTIFVQPQYAPQSVEVVAKALGGKVVLLDGFSGNVVANIEDIAGKIMKAMKESPPRRHGDHGEDTLK